MSSPAVVVDEETAKGNGNYAVLDEMDNQRLRSFHLKVILIAGMGFFCDAYDLFVISYVTSCISRIYYPDSSYFSPDNCDTSDGYPFNSKGDACGSHYHLYAQHGISPEDAVHQIPGDMPTGINSAIKACALAGTFFGQLAFGYLGDIYGRRPMFGLSLMILIFGAIGQGLSFGSCAGCVVGTLCAFRFVLGFGIGGDYPLSSTIMSEFASAQYRGGLIAAVFAQQGTGILVSSIVSIVVAKIFEGHPSSADYIWRTVLVFGAIPAICTMYFRINMPESPRYKVHREGKADEAQRDMAVFMKDKPDTGHQHGETEKVERASLREFAKAYGWELLGTAMCWFLLDIAFYSQNFFQSTIYSNIGWVEPAYTYTAAGETYAQARAALIISLCSTIPGYWVTVFTVDKLGRLPIQIVGFSMMTLCMVILTAAYEKLVDGYIDAFLVIYALGFFFANFGPNTTTFIIPAELYPTRYRSTGHGFSAACGKLGAIVGTFGFAASAHDIGVKNSLGILSAINFLGLLFTYFVPETKGRTLEQISGDGDSNENSNSDGREADS